MKIENTGLKNPIYSFSFRKDQNEKRQALLVVARIHPYETAGSYCLDGAIRKMLSNGEYLKEILINFDIILIPILTPDGVMKGFCRLNGSSEFGIDLGRQWSDLDPVCMAIKKLASARPIAGYIEIHNWMHHKIDGIKYLNFWKTNRFIRAMHKLQSPNKAWQKCLRHGFFSERLTGVKQWAKENTGAECMMVEYPWRERNVEDMSLLGFNTIQAFLKLIDR